MDFTIAGLRRSDADEAVLEAEVDNLPALSLYEGKGFVRDKRLMRYYLNGKDAFRLKLWLKIGDTLSVGGWQMPLNVAQTAVVGEEGGKEAE